MIIYLGSILFSLLLINCSLCLAFLFWTFQNRDKKKSLKMAGGIISSNNAKEYPGKVTAFMRLSGIMAAACGLMFGYDIGISGMNLSM